MRELSLDVVGLELRAKSLMEFLPQGERGKVLRRKEQELHNWEVKHGK